MAATPNLNSTASLDPFTQILAGLWDMMDNSVEVNKFVAQANRIKFLDGYYVDSDGNTINIVRQEPVKDQATDSDRPELIIEPAYGLGSVDQMTSTELWRWRWDISVASGRQQLDRVGYAALGASLFPVYWAVYQTLIGTMQKLKLLQIDKYKFVHAVRPGSIEISRDNPRLLHGLMGWSGTWPFYTDVNIDVIRSMSATLG
jgi:hypothetical protein